MSFFILSSLLLLFRNGPAGCGFLFRVDSDAMPIGWRRVSQSIRGLVLGMSILHGAPVHAQNAPVVALQTRRDLALYGKHSPNACPRKLAREKKQVDMQCLTRVERRWQRRQYQEGHRSEFPAVYYPGIE
jgi:hypothetical protein